MSNIAGGGGGSASWVTALDVDFSAESSQALNADGPYTIAGFTFTKINSVHDATAMALTNGAGVVIIPDQVSTWSTVTRTLPALTVSLSAIIPDYDLTMRLRVWMRITSANLSANNHFVCVGLENWVKQTAFFCSKMWVTGNNCYNRTIYAGAHPGDFGIAWTAGHDVIQIHEIHSMANLNQTGTYAGGWPAEASLSPVALRVGGTTSLTTAVPLGLATDWDVLIGAGRYAGAAALTVTIGALKIEYAL